MKKIIVIVILLLISVIALTMELKEGVELKNQNQNQNQNQINIKNIKNESLEEKILIHWKDMGRETMERLFKRGGERT
jgi:uncharacterized alpha/beta hydrolase family protein